jgi:hypothetical protein
MPIYGTIFAIITPAGLTGIAKCFSIVPRFLATLAGEGHLEKGAKRILRNKLINV